MNEQDIRITELAPMKVASAYAYCESPEFAALAAMQDFAEANDLLKHGQLPPTFGFNNPNPSAGSPNYGYEVWLPLQQEIQPSGDVRIIDFEGGLYAVARCRSLANIGEEWLALAKWREGTSYAQGKHQWLEHLLSPVTADFADVVIDLYLPIDR